MKLTVAKKMALLAGTALIGIAILTGLSQSLLSKVFDAANYNSVNTVPSLLVLSDVRQEIARYRLRIDRHVMNTDAAKMTELEKSIKEAADNTEKLFKKYEGVISDDKDKALLQKVRDAFASYMKDADLVLVESRANRNDQARDLIEKNVKTARDLDAALTEHLTFNADLGHRSAEEADKTRSTAVYLGLGIAALTLIIVATLAFFITRNLLRQLGGEPDLAAEVANKIAGGDVSTRIEVKPGDTTSLMVAMQKLADKQRVRLICSHDLHRMKIILSCRLQRIINIMCLDLLIKHLYAFFLIVGQQTAFKANLSQSLKQSLCTFICRCTVRN